MCSLQACEGAGHDFDENKLLDDQDKLEFTKLSEMVRCTYVNYLEKQLFKNFKTCYAYRQHGGNHILCDEEAIGPIKQTAKFLEDKAVAACMITQFYQKAMVKIISAVRRSTEEKRLLTQLEKTILQPVLCNIKSCSKQTQTEEAGLQGDSFETPDGDLSLDEKMELFQSNLKSGIVAQPPAKRIHTYSSELKSSQYKKTPKRTYNHNHCQQSDKRRQYSPFKENLEQTSPASSIVTPTQSLKSSDAHQDHFSEHINESVADLENSNDSVAVELARLFSEEKTELDEIFGIDPNENPDDPHICEILREIEQAKVCHKEEPTNQSESEASRDKLNSNTHHTLSTPGAKSEISQSADLSKSVWPCELFMQRRKLSESLARLIEEDLRWHDLIKWRFFELFGADSDDEFTAFSPSIELDEVLMGSCVKRISPWVVKYLMKPMNEGLIGNRFIFKKLAKHLARSIIIENQYPDESVIKRCIENYFCLHQSVLSLDDYQFAPSISLL